MRKIEISEMSLTIEENDEEAGKMNILFINDKKCMFIPDEDLEKKFSKKEMDEIKNLILARLELKWTQKEIEID